MKKRVLISTILFGMAIGITYFLIGTFDTARLPSSGKSAIGTSENPRARMQFEWRRLRNPKSNTIPQHIHRKELTYAATLPTREIGLLKTDAIVFQNLAWTERGPFNLGGRTRALAIDQANESMILAGGVSGGIWRSTDGGSSWTLTTDPAQLHNITCLAQDTRANKTATWYVGTGEFVGNSASGKGAPYLGDGMFKSTDGGLNWTSLSSTFSGTPQVLDQLWDYVWNIVTDVSNSQNDEVYAATYGAIHRSVDGGASWTVALGGSSPFSSYTDVAISSSGVVYATLSDEGSDAGIWRSTDGLTWTKITPAGWPAIYDRVVIGLAPSNENIVYFLASTPGTGTLDHHFWKYTYLSGNGAGNGAIWENRTANIPAFGGQVGDFDSQSSYDLVVKVLPDEENTVFIGGTNLYRSTDGLASTGNTDWIGGYSILNDNSIYPNHHPDQHALVFLPSDSRTMISAHDGGLSKTSNSTEQPVLWANLNFGYFTTQFYTVAIDHATPGNHIVIGGMQDNGTWFTNDANSTNPWVRLLSGDGSFCAIANGRSRYYVSFPYGSIVRLRLSDNGVLSEWTKVTPTGASGFLFINPFVLDPNDSKIMYLPAGSNLWRNADLIAIPAFSNNTTTVNWTNLTNAAVANDTISAVAISSLPANRLYYGTISGRVFRLDGANAGNPLALDIFSGKGLPAGYVSCVAIDPTDADRALLVFSNYEVQSLFYTSNAGATWTDVSGNLEENPNGSGSGPSTRWAEILPASTSTYYFVATSTGLYSTTSLDGAATVWSQEGSSTIGKVVVDMIDSRMSDGLVVAATHGRGVFSGFIDNPVPVELTSFSGKRTPARFEVVLHWQTATETNNFGFDIERNLQRDARGWQKIGFVKGNDTSSFPHDYVYVDRIKPEIEAGVESLYYRLKQIDTDGSFVFSSPIEVALNYQPEAFALFQNYPNPFNPTTTIAYELPAGGHVKLEIFNTRGQKITTLLNSNQSPGHHEVVWDAEESGVASGFYFYRLELVPLHRPGERMVESRRMMLVR